MKQYCTAPERPGHASGFKMKKTRADGKETYVPVIYRQHAPTAKMLTTLSRSEAQDLCAWLIKALDYDEEQKTCSQD